MISTSNTDKTFVLSAATNYSYSFKVFASADLKVEWTAVGATSATLLTEGLHYTVDGEGEDTGSITLLNIDDLPWWGNGDSLYVHRHTPVLQETQFKNIREFLSGVHENSFDRVIAILQEFVRDGMPGADGGCACADQVVADLADTSAFKGDSLIAVLKTGAVTERTQHDVNDDFLTVEDFVQDGDADYTAAIQRCMDSQELVYFPKAKTYGTSEPLVQSRRNHFLGVGRGSMIVNSASDIFHVGGSASLYQSTWENIGIVSSAAGDGGHVFAQKGTVVRCRFINLYIEQQHGNKSIYSHTEDLGNYLDNDWIDGEWWHTYTATAPAFNFVVMTATGATNSNRWKGATCTRASKPWFHFESQRVNNYIYDVKIEDMLFEVPLQGIVVGLGVDGFTCENCKVYDLNAQSGVYPVSADMFYFGRGTNASNQPSRNIEFHGYSRTDSDATMEGFVDFRFASASGASAQSVTFNNCLRTLAVDLLADLTNVYDITIFASRIAVSGTGYVRLTRVDSSGVSSALVTVQEVDATNAGITSEGGLYTLLVAGESLARGEVVYIKDTSGADGKVWKCPTSNDKPIGIVYANASANAAVKIVTNGIAYALPESGITAVRGNVMLTSTTAAGRVAQSAAPNTTEHWRECGHFLDTGSGNGALTRAVLHFN